MICEYTSIPELIKQHGSMKKVQEVTGFAEMTVSRHRFDVKCEKHIVIDGRLYTVRGKYKRASREL